MKILNAAISDVGLKRKVNEDTYYVSKDDGIFLVADGMGGHLAGDMASRIAVDTIADFIKKTTEDRDITWPFQRNDELTYEANRLIVAIKLANKKIYSTARERNLPGMGTTIACLFYQNGVVNICHVGDSRIYRIREGKIEQLTEDHSLLVDSLKDGKITEEEAQNFPFKNVITRALGIEDNVEVDVKRDTIKDGDYFILCTDGLTNFVSQKLIKDSVLNNKTRLLKACKNMIDIANGKGGTDNSTVILVKFSEGKKKTAKKKA